MSLASSVDEIEFAEVCGRRLEYRILNRERSARPWLVFLHEGLGSVAMWKDFPKLLCDALDARGLVYSRYGYGRSDALPAAARPRQRGVDFMHREARESLPALLALLGIRRLLLFGHSDGASIALLFASYHANEIAGAVVLAPHVKVEELSVTSIAAARRAYETTDLRARLARYHDDPDSAFRGWNDIWLNPDFRNWNIEAELARITCPVLAIQGVDDEYGTLAQIESLARRAGRATTLVLSACGHSPHRDQPQAVLEAVQRFVAGIDGFTAAKQGESA